MKKLEDFRNDYAKEKHYDNWNDFFYRATAKAIEKGYDIVAERFANAKAKALLEEAAEKMRNRKHIIFEREENFHPMREYNKGLESAANIALSLIPKQETK